MNTVQQSMVSIKLDEELKRASNTLVMQIVEKLLKTDLEKKLSPLPDDQFLHNHLEYNYLEMVTCTSRKWYVITSVWVIGLQYLRT